MKTERNASITITIRNIERAEDVIEHLIGFLGIDEDLSVDALELHEVISEAAKLSLSR